MLFFRGFAPLGTVGKGGNRLVASAADGRRNRDQMVFSGCQNKQRIWKERESLLLCIMYFSLESSPRQVIEFESAFRKDCSESLS